jgi:hypothetical protein
LKHLQAPASAVPCFASFLGSLIQQLCERIALERVEHPIAARARAGDYKTRLIVNPEQAPHVVWMYDRFVTAEWGTLQIAEDLNRRGIPSPGHTDTRRNLAMFGSTVKGRYHYMRCDYGRQHGREAAEAIPGHGQWCNVREDLLMGFVLDFFERRVFGEARMDLRSSGRYARGEMGRAGIEPATLGLRGPCSAG